jgi:hypothetical protein
VLTKERLLHPGTIIAVIALLVALSGMGYAAATIGTAQLKNNAVTTPKIKNGAVNTAKLKNNAVNSSKLASGAVKAADLANGAVTSAKLANGAVTGAKLANGSVGTAELVNGAVDSAKLGNGSVSGEKLGANAVTGPKIAGGTITAANIAPGQVVTGKGSFLAATLALPTNGVETPVLTVPGVGLLRATCTAAPTTTAISFQNTSAGAAVVVAWGTNGLTVPATAVSQQSALLSTESTAVLSSTAALGLEYQVSFRKAGNPEVLTATVSAAPSTEGCSVTASAVTTG